MKPVLFLCPTLFNVRNVLHSDLLPQVRRLGLRPIVLTRAANTRQGPFAESGTVASANAECGELTEPSFRRSRVPLTALDIVQRASFFRRYGLSSDRVSLWWYRRDDPVWSRTMHAALEKLAVVGSRSPFYEWQLARLSDLKRRTMDLRPALDQLRAIRPAAVVATSCISRTEEPYLLAARELGIPTLGYIQSFDHITGRSFTGDCDFYAVWSERMRSELIRYHNVRDPEGVRVTGTTQFDFHRRPEFRWSREDTLHRLGLHVGDRYILYAANTFPQTPSEPDLVREFARRATETPALSGHRIVVRLHPNDDFGRWTALEQDRRLVLSRPSPMSETFGGPDDQAKLVSTTLHADVCINMWSSMSLDAAVLDTPAVCVGFAWGDDRREGRFCRMVYEADFYVPIIESGAVRLAESMDALVAGTIDCVADPARHTAERARLAASECGPLDGRSAERLAALTAEVAGVAGARGGVAA